MIAVPFTAPCRFSFFLHSDGGTGATTTTSLLAGSYVAVKGAGFVKHVRDVGLLCRHVLFGQAPYGKRVSQAAVLEAGVR